MAAFIFFIAMLVTLAFTIFLYIRLVIAVKQKKDVPGWMYKIGHALKGRERGEAYKDFTDHTVLHDVNTYVLGVILVSIAVYFLLYDRDATENKLFFWVRAEFFIIVGMRAVLFLGKLLLAFLHPIKTYNREFSAAANAVISMMLLSAFACMLSFALTGLPVKAPVVEVGDAKIVIGKTTAGDLLSNGFSFLDANANIEKNANDVIVNQRDSHFFFGERAWLVKDGKEYGYVNVTPRYKDEAKLGDCVITYFGITSKSNRFDEIKLCDRTISELSLDDFRNEKMTEIFSLSPISYQEIAGSNLFSLKMQTYPYMLWKCYTIDVSFPGNEKPNQFEVYAQHTIWE